MLMNRVGRSPLYRLALRAYWTRRPAASRYAAWELVISDLFGMIQSNLRTALSSLEIVICCASLRPPNKNQAALILTKLESALCHPSSRKVERRRLGSRR